MRKLFCLFIATIAAVSAGSAIAAPKRLIMDGECLKLTISGKDQTPDCMDKVANTDWKNSRMSLHFMTNSGAAVTFSGTSKNQISGSGDTSVRPIDMVIFGFNGKHSESKAVGYCRLSNVPGRVAIDCVAEVSGGKVYAGSFLTAIPPDK